MEEKVNLQFEMFIHYASNCYSNKSYRKRFIAMLQDLSKEEMLDFLIYVYEKDYNLIEWIVNMRLELKDFNSKFVIVSSISKKKRFEDVFRRRIFTEIQGRVNFFNYEYVSTLYEKLSALKKVETI